MSKARHLPARCPLTLSPLRLRLRPRPRTRSVLQQNTIGSLLRACQADRGGLLPRVHLANQLSAQSPTPLTAVCLPAAPLQPRQDFILVVILLGLMLFFLVRSLAKFKGSGIKVGWGRVGRGHALRVGALGDSGPTRPTFVTAIPFLGFTRVHVAWLHRCAATRSPVRALLGTASLLLWTG